MNRLTALPLFGFFTVFGVIYVLGGFESVPFADRAGGFVLGLLAVMAMIAGFAFAKGFRSDDDDEQSV